MEPLTQRQRNQLVQPNRFYLFDLVCQSHDFTQLFHHKFAIVVGQQQRLLQLDQQPIDFEECIIFAHFK